MISIDGKDYDENALPDVAKVQLNRVMQLRNELVELHMVAEDRRIALNAREQELVRLIKASEEGQEDDGAA